VRNLEVDDFLDLAFPERIEDQNFVHPVDKLPPGLLAKADKKGRADAANGSARPPRPPTVRLPERLGSRENPAQRGPNRVRPSRC